MEEVKVGCFAGPYKTIPYKNCFVQSPIGLVPKSGGKTRLIFHLSYDFPNGNKSINHWTPQELASVKYNDLDHAVKNCLKLMEELGVNTIYFAKSDLKNAFRILGIFPGHRCYLVMKARDPKTKEWFFFVDKCLPFGASISCSHFQHFSNALKRIVEVIASRSLRTLISNYLDDFLFLYISKEGCNKIVIIFLRVCKDIQFPVSIEKTEWSDSSMIFLGMLLNGCQHTLSISLERRNNILQLVNAFCDRKKATIKQLEQLAGHLNFVNRVVVPGRAFTRRMYVKFTGLQNSKGESLKPHHHIKLDREFKSDCRTWKHFLTDLDSVVRPFIDLSAFITAEQLQFFMDASANPVFGYGAIFGDRWLFGQWEKDFIKTYDPSIEFLELFALCAGVMTWSTLPTLQRKRVVIFCDNISVIYMVNNLTSGCLQCMKLLRLLTLSNLKSDRGVFVRHIEGRKNSLSDALSRQNLTKFFNLAPPTINKYPDNITDQLWPLTKIWKVDMIDDLI